MAPLIAIDVGGTIEDTWSAKRSWLIPKGFDIGITPVGRRDVVGRIGGDEALYEAMVSEIYSDGGIASHDLTDGCAEALEVLATRFRVVLLTSRPAHQYAITRDWLASRRIDGLIDDLICVGSYRSKVESCRALSARFMVDDDMRHFETIKLEDDLRAIHYSMGGRSAPAWAGVLSASNWPDVVSIVWRLNRGTETTAVGGVER